MRPHSAKQLRLAAEAREQRIGQRQLLLPLAEQLRGLSRAEVTSEIIQDVALVPTLGIFRTQRRGPKVAVIRSRIAEYVDELKRCLAIALSTYSSVSDLPLRVIVKDVELALSSLAQALNTYNEFLEGLGAPNKTDSVFVLLDQPGDFLKLLVNTTLTRAAEEKLKTATVLLLQFAKPPSR